jgi:hypothetical protein
LARTNYAFEKRQRELMKKQKKEAKRQKQAEAHQPTSAPPDEEPVTSKSESEKTGP